MTAQTDSYISSIYNINIKDIVSNHLDFSSAGKFDFNETVPRKYKVLIPDPHRGSSSSFGSPCTSNGDRDRHTSYQSSLYESSTASSSPLSITKELTSVGSPLTPRSDISRSKSKSPSRAGGFLADTSKSPTPGLNVTLTNESSRSPPSPIHEICKTTNTTNGLDDHEPVKKKKKKKKKKKCKKKDRTDSPTDVSPGRTELTSSLSTVSSNSNDSTESNSSLPTNNDSTPKGLSTNDSSPIDAAKVAPIRLKLKEPERNSLSNVFESLTSPIKPKVVTIKLGSEVMRRRVPLVDYKASDDDDEKADDTQSEDDDDGTTTVSKSKANTLMKPPPTAAPMMSPRSIIGPLKPSTLPLPKREIMPAPSLSPATSISSSVSKVSPLVEKLKRKNGEIETTSDSPAVKRKRLLSERGEKEAAYPIMDKSTISHWNWKDCSVVRNRSRGAGLHNSCNDCFLNAILQVITHTAPLCRYILEKHQHERCLRPHGQCICCAMRTSHFSRAFSGSAFMPSWIRPHLRKIFPSHMHGMQEDAHELLSLMLDAIDPPPGSNKTNGVPSGINAKPSTPIEQIFGGTLRNQITCTQCNTPFINYERIRELNLAIRKRNDGGAIRIANLMDNYFRDENVASFDCKKCGCKTTANRRTRVLRPPAVLLVQLKRFNAFGGKIRLPVGADMDVDIARLMFDSATPAASCQYVLTAVVEHLGSGVDHGHYIAYCRGFDHKQWHLFDDEMVSTISPGKVGNSEPYILVYSRRSDMGMSAKSSAEIATSSSSPIGPGPMVISHKNSNMNRSGGLMHNGNGHPKHNNHLSNGQFNRSGFNNYGGAFKKSNNNNNMRFRPTKFI